jgi:hypothetical protein
MDDEQRYYAALAASAISTVAWLGAVAGVAYTLVLLATGGSYQQVAVLTAAAVLVGIVFAKTEAMLYDMDDHQ